MALTNQSYQEEFQKAYQQGFKIGYMLGVYQAPLEIAYLMLQIGFEPIMVKKFTKLSLKEIKELL